MWGSIYRFDGQVSVWWAGHGPCYRCVFPEPPPPGMVPSCAEGGVLGVLCAAIGSVQATETIKLLTGVGEPLVGRLVVHDALRQTWDTLTVRKDPDCAVCGTSPTVTELVDYEVFCGVRRRRRRGAATVTATELAAALAGDGGDPRSTAPVTLVDVRGPDEREIVSIPGAVAIHLDQLRSGAGAVAGPVRPRGRRALQVRRPVGRGRAHPARRRGHPDVRSLDGGVLAWVPRRRPEPARLLTVTELPDYEEAVLEVVDAIPEGCVMTYGDVAEMVGAGGRAGSAG